jgi:histidinol-phosphate aminotransferase
LKEFYKEAEELTPYHLGETIPQLVEQLGLPRDKILKLNANENLFISDTFIRNVLRKTLLEIDARLYPQDEREKLQKLLAANLGVSIKQIVIGSGGDQIIELVLSSLLRMGDNILIVTPTFSMYERNARKNRLNLQEVMLDKDFQLNPEKVLSKAGPNTKLIVICNPNNPTGNQFDKKKVLQIVEAFKGVVMIDEAYADFSSYSLTKDAEDYSNLLILRTFSKTYALAGMRLGYAVSNNRIATILNEKYQTPYPVSQLVLMVGVKILGYTSLFQKSIDRIKEERAWLIKSLNNIDKVRAFPSDTNFVLFNTEECYQDLYEKLLEKGVILRKIGKVPGYENCLRVTVAPRRIMMVFINALKEVIK